MQIVETFLSLQGEGAFMGRLAIFVRFAGCNFNCAGFGVKKEKNGQILQGCDTLRAVFINEFQKDYENLGSKVLFEKVMKLRKNFNPIIVLSGGEPLLYYKNAEFLEFLRLLLAENLEVHFESNASIELDFDAYPLYEKCSFALGVKLSNSGVCEEKRLNFKALKTFKERAKKSFYKFVLSADFLDKAKDEIAMILSRVENEVYCMPLGENEKILQQNARAVAEFCINNGYHYCDRIHIRIWGDKEGV